MAAARFKRCVPFALLAAALAWGQQSPDAPSPASPASPDSQAALAPRPEPEITKSDLVLPAVSVIIPGFGQLWQGEASGWAYSGVALGGIALMAQGYSEIPEGESIALDPIEGIESWSERKILLGGMAYLGSGFLSAYGAFRTTVPAYQEEEGKYKFLTGRETLGDMFLSPFRFSHLAKLSSWLPLGLLTGAVTYRVIDERTSNQGADWVFSADDLLITGSVAYNAGLTEEAAFRGWLLPLAYQFSGETWWMANAAQAILFGAAHYQAENPYPWPQTLLGFYFGHLTRKNGWTLSEAIFVHFWWDALLFTGEYLTLRRAPAAAFRLELPIPL